jgi:hypothetical protein
MKRTGRLNQIRLLIQLLRTGINTSYIATFSSYRIVNSVLCFSVNKTYRLLFPCVYCCCLVCIVVSFLVCIVSCLVCIVSCLVCIVVTCLVCIVVGCIVCIVVRCLGVLLLVVWCVLLLIDLCVLLSSYVYFL